MEKSEFERIMERAGKFAHSSMQYLDFEDLADYKPETSNEDLILLLGYDKEAKCQQYHWAADSADKLIPQLTCQEPFLLTFVPEAWVPELEAAGLRVRNKWHDYFRPNLDDIRDISESELDYLSVDEVNTASALTLQCRGQTRGFTGQTPAWFAQYLRGDGSVKNPAVLVYRLPNGEIAGLVCTGTYGHDEEKGAIVWVREVAVSPQHQNRGIGRRLVSLALQYGKRCGASKAFLAVDEENTGAIHLYESLGFVASKDNSEINMIKG
jgi:ribosomal protein S18 acetylase RimI-like enzyme